MVHLRNWIVALVVGLLVGLLAAYFYVELAKAARVLSTVKTETVYNNREEWEFERDERGRTTKVIVHRHATAGSGEDG